MPRCLFGDHRFSGLGHPFYGIAEAGAFSQITIANGAVRVTTNTNLIGLVAINMVSSAVMTFENLNLVGKAPILNQEAPPLANMLLAGPDTLVRHVVGDGFINLTCPSVVVDSVGLVFTHPDVS